MEQNNSFRDMKFKDKIISIVSVALLIMMTIGILFSLYFFGMAGIFQLLDVQYESIWSLALFVVCFFIIGGIVDLFFHALFELTVENMTGAIKLIIIQITYETISNLIVLFTLDELMKSIKLSLQVEFLIALLIAFIESVFTEDKKKDVANLEEL